MLHIYPFLPRETRALTAADVAQPAAKFILVLQRVEY